MKTFIILPFLVAFTAQVCRAQYFAAVDSPKYKMIKQDTINIRGVVYDALGAPVRGVYVVSQNQEKVFEGYPIYAITDKDGKFRLDGALVLDTLELRWETKIKVINKGSRYLELHLPYAPKETSTSGAVVTARRVAAKKGLPTFKVLTNAQISDYFGLPILLIDPQYPGGADRLARYLNPLVKYPQKAVDNNIEGQVEISFSVDRDGTPFGFRVVRGIGYGCEDAVIDVLRTSPKWRPAIVNGIPQVGKAAVIVDFKLEDK